MNTYILFLYIKLAFYDSNGAFNVKRVKTALRLKFIKCAHVEETGSIIALHCKKNYLFFGEVSSIYILKIGSIASHLK